MSLTLAASQVSVAASGYVSVGDFLRECQEEKKPCVAFVLGAVEGARHQTREWLKDQPYAYRMHNQAVCLPAEWDGLELTETVISILTDEPQTHEYSAVSGILYALATKSTCREI